MNPITMQGERARNAKTHFGARDHDRAYFSLLDDWGALNGLRRSGEFTLHALSRGGRSGGQWGEAYTYPGCDHPSYFRRAGNAAAVVIEPYQSSDLELLRDYAKEHGLVASSPPNDRASFWFPPFTVFIALTAPGFGPVRWLPSQMTYVGRPK